MIEILIAGGQLELDLERELVKLKFRREFDLEDTIVALPLLLVRAVALKVYQLELAADLAQRNGGTTGPQLVAGHGRPV